MLIIRSLLSRIVSFIALLGIVLLVDSTAMTVRYGYAESPSDNYFMVEGVSMTRRQVGVAVTEGTQVNFPMTEDFENDWPNNGWALEDLSDNDGGEYLWNKRDCNPRQGQFGSWSVGGGAQGSTLSCSDNYPNNANVWAIYGPFDLQNATSTNLTFHVWGKTEAQDGCPTDQLFIGSSIDNLDYEGAFLCGNLTNGPDGNGYGRIVLNLNNRVGHNQVWIAFAFISNSDISDIGITIDDITLDATPAPPPMAVPISAGTLHTCATVSSGGAKCWGGNLNGQLGDNSTTDRRTPVDVAGLSSGVTSVAAGSLHSCALTSGGGVKCWGGNAFGQLGDGTATTRLTPVDVVGLNSRATSIAVGELHSCAVTSNWKVECWGDNRYGQLGDGSLASSTSPVRVLGLYGELTAVTVGDTHTCALVNGGVGCWGKNDLGQLGNGTTIGFHVPIPVIGLNNQITAIAAGSLHTCALTTEGGVKCWGFNNFGQLGDGTYTIRSTPADVVGLSSGVTAIAAGGFHTCALTSSGGVKCWGSNQFGQLGNNTTTGHITPSDVAGLTSGVTAITAGHFHSCALTSSGGKCWGRNVAGQLGDNSTTDRLVPVNAVGLGGGNPVQSVVVVPVYPQHFTSPSEVMRGGTVQRYFRLEDDVGNRMGNATVQFSQGAAVNTSSTGEFYFQIAADRLGAPGSYVIRIESITSGGHSLPLRERREFTVLVKEREYTHSWSYGAATRGKGGTSAGVVKYIEGTTSGGMEIKLKENTPDITSDDITTMEHFYSNEAGFGGGVGAEAGVKILILKLKIGAEATTEFKLRNFGHTAARFSNPYQPDDRKAQAIFLLASLIDTISNNFPDKPRSIALLRAALTQGSLYQSYVIEQQAGSGSKVTPLRTNVGASASLGLTRDGVTWKQRMLGFDLVDLNISILGQNTFTDYRDRNEIGLGNEAEFDLDFSALSVQIGGFKNKFLGLIESRAKKIQQEIILDATTEQVKRFELSLTGEGNPLEFTDIAIEEVTVKVIVPADQLTPEVQNRTINVFRLIQASLQTGNNPLEIGPSALVNELNTLLESLDFVEYEVTVSDGAETAYPIEVGITLGAKLELGREFSVKKTHTFVYERGFFLNGSPYKTETYNRIISRPGKTWEELTANALGGLWDYAKDFFGSTWQQVESGAAWTMGVVSRTIDGTIWGGAWITAPPQVQFYTGVYDTSPAADEETNSITIIATGWHTIEDVEGFTSNSSEVTASGDSFAIGGIYNFQPYTLTLSPAATLHLTYTDAAIFGIDENLLGLYQWNYEENNWQVINAQADLEKNTFTADITRLGTFAIGYDNIPPQIIVSDPIDGETINNSSPLISARITDEGVGIDPTTIEMKLDGQTTNLTYVIATGELYYIPILPLSKGSHEFTVSVSDAAQNRSSRMVTFTVEESLPVDDTVVYLPLIQRCQ